MSFRYLILLSKGDLCVSNQNQIANDSSHFRHCCVQTSSFFVHSHCIWWPHDGGNSYFPEVLLEMTNDAITFHLTFSSFLKKKKLRWCECHHFIKYDTGFITDPPLHQIKACIWFSIDFLMSLKLFYQQLVSWTNEYVNGWLQINDIVVSSKVFQFLFKWKSIKLDVLVLFCPKLEEMWQLFFATGFSHSVTELLLSKHLTNLKNLQTKRLSFRLHDSSKTSNVLLFHGGQANVLQGTRHSNY